MSSVEPIMHRWSGSEDNSSDTGSSPKPQMEKKQLCCAPMQCIMSKSIAQNQYVSFDRSYPLGILFALADKEVDEFQNDTVKVICSSAECKEGQFMHRVRYIFKK